MTYHLTKEEDIIIEQKKFTITGMQLITTKLHEIVIASGSYISSIHIYISISMHRHRNTHKTFFILMEWFHIHESNKD